LPAWPFELVATTDPCPEPLVFSLGYTDLYYQGWLLATINFSDLAAAGAEPLGLLVSYLRSEGWVGARQSSAARARSVRVSQSVGRLACRELREVRQEANGTGPL